MGGSALPKEGGSAMTVFESLMLAISFASLMIIVSKDKK